MTADPNPNQGSETMGTRTKQLGFTLVELLVTITIITMLAGLTLGAIHLARQTAREASTRALITKLDRVIMQRCESYMTRRVAIRTRGLQPAEAARMRLEAMRDLMRMELPERWNDITYPPITDIKRPALTQMYLIKYKANEPSAEFGPAECLYMIIAMGTPDAMEHFRESEIGDADGDEWPEFHDGWGRPIMFLRWAPAFTAFSEIQTPEDHDPFDTRNIDPGAFHLIPLIYSGGRDKQYDLEVNETYIYEGDPYASGAGRPVDNPQNPDGSLNHHDNIHNHAMSQK